MPNHLEACCTHYSTHLLTIFMATSRWAILCAGVPIMLLHLQVHTVGNAGRALFTACAMPALLLVHHVEAPATHVRHIAELWLAV